MEHSMNWLLWREYRLNRWILITGAAAIALSAAIGFLAVSFKIDEELNEFGAALVLVWSFLTVALLAGNAFAGERADRSTEFIDYLPLERSRRLASKLLLHVIVLGVLVGVNALMVGQLLTIDEFAGGVAFALVVYCVNWFVSSIQSSPALATMSGFAALGLTGLGAAFLEERKMIANQPAWLIWFSAAIGCVLPIACFSFGTWNYLRRSEP
jgi:ABC-type transport system involved in multi-copper enzyme maturation permease subunit